MYSVFVGIQIIAILLTFAAIALIIHMDGSNAQKMMVCYMIGVLVHNTGNLFEVLSNGPAEATVAIKIQYMGACFIPLFFSEFIFLYCNLPQPKWLFRCIGYMDLALLGLVWTCDSHHMFYEEMKFLTNGDHPHFEFTYSWGFWLFIWFGALLPFGLAVWALIRSFLDDYYQRRKRYYIVFIVLSLIPAGALLLRAGQKMKDYDLVPPTLAIVLSFVVIFVWSRRNYDLSHAAAETVLHELDDGVIFLDEQQRIVGYNPAMEDIFYDLDKRIIGKKITKVRNFPEELMLDTGTREFDFDGRHFEGHIRPVNDKDKTLLGYVVLIFDITQRKRLVMESIEMQEKAEAASKAKSEFMAAMSHEMRTPMNAIVGFAELIKEESLGRKVYQYACDIKAASGRLLEIFNDIWDISSVEAGKMELVQKEYSSERFLQDVSDKVNADVAEKGLIFEQRVSDTFPAGLYGDEGRIRQVLDNVLDNAIKFTDKGRISMMVDGDYISEDQIMVKYLIKDTGIGIDEKDLKKIFYNFEQVDSSESRSVEGIGLGLSVAKNIAELMGGSLHADSVLGRGSTFTIRIPQKVTDKRSLLEVTREVVEPQEELNMFSAPTSQILVVDDNLINRRIIKGMLRDYGGQIDEAESGPEAIGLVKAKKYDIIFMDHMMPEMDGLEATQHIRQECGENGTAPAVIALTANAMKGVKEMFMGNGFQGFATKPTDKITIHKILSQWIPDDKKQSVSGKTVQQDIDFDEIADIFINGINVQKALEQHTGNLQEYVDILNLFHLDGLRKVEYLQALAEQEDYTNYRIEVHALKSASANIGAQELSKQAELLEMAATAGNTEFIAENNDALLKAYNNLLHEIKSVLDKLKKTQQPDSSDSVKEPLAKEDVMKLLTSALDSLEHFKSKECKENVERLLNHALDGNLQQELLNIQSKLQLYEDDDAEDLLRVLIQKYSD